jgi:SagB-type dehydrogenase family enzyme
MASAAARGGWRAGYARSVVANEASASNNGDTRVAREFHAASSYRVAPTAEEPERVGMGPPGAIVSPIWQEDWSIEPRPYKVYRDLEPIPLPRSFVQTSMSALDALSRRGDEPSATTTPDLQALARLGRLSNGLLERGRSRRRGLPVEFRTAGGTGARYHLEVYFVCGALRDLEAGVYHYATQDHTLRQLRRGDFREVVIRATGEEPAVAHAPVIMALTSTFWRNAWRYKARAYRHAFWDAGTSLANFLGVSASLELSTELVFGFVDSEVNALLGIDGEREATLALCAIGRDGPPVPKSADVQNIALATEPVSSSEVTFPEIPRMHAASQLHSAAEVTAWRANPLRRAPKINSASLTPLAPRDTTQMSIEQVILARRSTRHYDTARQVPFEAFSTVLDRSARGFAADALAPNALPLHDNYLIANGVAGLEPGVYVYHPGASAVELLKSGDFRQTAGRLAFFQEYAADAHVNSYYLADLDAILERYGNRGYGLVQLESALFAGRLHLATHAVGLRAVGSTSLDDEVVEFFSPRAAGSSYMFVTMFGLRRSSRAG